MPEVFGLIYKMRFLIHVCALGLVVFWAIAETARAQTAKTKIPQTLAEAHCELEKWLTAEELVDIDKMNSEEGMIKYHFSLGLDIRNRWGLWHESTLAKHLHKLGVFHPDAMSSLILETFWCKRHHEPFRLKEKAQVCSADLEEGRKAEKREAKRVKAVQVKLKKMMMGLNYEAAIGLQTVRMPNRMDSDSEVRARYLAKFRNGVFLTAKESVGHAGDDYVTQAYYFDPADRQIHKISVKEIEEMSSAVVVKDWAWFAGVKAGNKILLGINGNKRLKAEVPEPAQLPLLGVSGESVLAVYPHSAYRLDDGKWSIIYTGDLTLPHSGPPPQLFDNLLLFRDEGRFEDDKRLWWLNLQRGASLTAFDQDVGLVGTEGPRWENTFSYCVSQKGDLWITAGPGNAPASLVRRSKEGAYSVAILNNSIVFNPELLGSWSSDQGLSVSCVSSLPEGSMLLVGDRGLYRMEDTRVVRMLAFENTHQEIPLNNGANVYHWEWDPSNALILDERSYFISGTFGGVYVLERGPTGQFRFQSLDGKLGEPVIW